MAQSKTGLTTDKKFSVYSGHGQYIRAALGSRETNISATARADYLLAFNRDDAVRVCHQARRAGVSAWLVAAV